MSMFWRKLKRRGGSWGGGLWVVLTVCLFSVALDLLTANLLSIVYCHLARLTRLASLGSLRARSIHITIRERLSLSLLRDGGLSTFDLRGDLDLRILSPSQSHLRLFLSPSPSRITSLVSSPSTAKDLQFQQHPNVGKFGPGATGEERVIALKNPERGFPINQGVGVLRWRLSTKDESLVPINSEWRELQRG